MIFWQYQHVNPLKYVTPRVCVCVCSIYGRMLLILYTYAHEFIFDCICITMSSIFRGERFLSITFFKATFGYFKLETASWQIPIEKELKNMLITCNYRAAPPQLWVEWLGLVNILKRRTCKASFFKDFSLRCVGASGASLASGIIGKCETGPRISDDNMGVSNISLLTTGLIHVITVALEDLGGSFRPPQLWRFIEPISGLGTSHRF